MPAVTVKDITVLPRVVPPDWSKAKRPVSRDGIGYKLGGDLKGVHGTPTTLQES